VKKTLPFGEVVGLHKKRKFYKPTFISAESINKKTHYTKTNLSLKNVYRQNDISENDQPPKSKRR
jgi:hypothetical protein